MAGFPSTAELRERAAIEAANTLAPATPLLLAAACALLAAAGALVWLALANADRCLELAARV